MAKFKVIRRGLVEEAKVATADNERLAVDGQVNNDKGWKAHGDPVGWSYQVVPTEDDAG